MTTGIHRCDELKRIEDFGLMVHTAVPTAPAGITLTVSHLRKEPLVAEFGSAVSVEPFWLLQLSNVRGSILVIVHHCPFCGVKLEPPL
jgi:hypothetical protein